MIIYPEGEEPSVENVQVKLGDFNLAGNQIGGTVMFSAPEFSHGNIPGMSDIYSLGRLFLFMSTQKEIFYKLLFLPIESEEVLKKISSSLQKIEIISLVSKMTMFEPKL